MSEASHLFLSYNSRDFDKVRRVQRFLAQRGVETFFDQQNLRAGQNWPRALEHALRGASGVAVFVSAQVGNWQWPEIGFALDRQAIDHEFPVIPVLLDGADSSRSFLFLNTWVDLRGERLDDPEALNRLCDAVLHPDTTPNSQLPALNPYRGLEIFDETHSPFFFGREKFIDDLFERLTERRRRFVAVIGASGSGKSSVVRGGLIPKLRRRRPPNETWDVAVFTPGERPWFRIADALGPLRFPEKADADLDIEIDRLASALQSGELQLQSLLDRILRRQGKLHCLLLVVDQFEEIFTLTPSKERAAFVESLVGTLSVEGLVLLPTLRADFYGQAIEADRRLSDLLGQEQVTLGRMTPEELTRAVVEPARLTRLEFDPGLPELLLRDAGNEPGNLPLLQHALLELHTRRRGSQLTIMAYQAIGGIRKAIANSAEREYQRFAQLGQGDLVRRIFTQLVRLADVSDGLESTRRRVAVSVLPLEARPIVDELASYKFRFLVKANERFHANGPTEGMERAAPSQCETVEVAHEALIREWPRLMNWLNEDRSFYLWRQRLDQFHNEYLEHGRDVDYLLQSAALREAEFKTTDCMPEPLTPAQIDYIQASLDHRERDNEARNALEREAKEAREAQQQQALENAEAQRAHAGLERQRALAQSLIDRRRSIIAIAAGLITILLAVLWAFGGFASGF